MAITHADFHRVLSRLAVGEDVRVTGNRVVIGDGARRVEITLAEESQRRIALLTLPVTRVELTFRGYYQSEIAEFLARFERAFQRGGG